MTLRPHVDGGRSRTGLHEGPRAVPVSASGPPNEGLSRLRCCLHLAALHESETRCRSSRSQANHLRLAPLGMGSAMEFSAEGTSRTGDSAPR